MVTDRKPKTVVLHVYNKSDQLLGRISWYGPWRQYTFNLWPETHLIFNNGCLQDIADVLSSLNEEHKEK